MGVLWHVLEPENKREVVANSVRNHPPESCLMRFWAWLMGVLLAGSFPTSTTSLFHKPHCPLLSDEVWGQGVPCAIPRHL